VTGAEEGDRDRRWRLAPRALLVGWAALYLPLALLEHASLRTSGFDLSVFDYALASLGHGHLAEVPFMGHSLFAHHFMPTLALLVPIHRWSPLPGPVTLIVLQLASTAAAAAWLHRLAARRLPPLLATTLLFAFLFSRRSHGAVTSFFYLESLEPLLVLGLVAWSRSPRKLFYWALTLLALGCKEDMALYVGSFGLWLATSADTRRRGLATAAVAALWLALAVGLAIPEVRRADRLDPKNPFVAARYAEPGSERPTAFGLISRVASPQSGRTLFSLTGSVAFSCWAAPAGLLPAVPGVLASLAARPGTQQATLQGHYLWPVLPWLYLAAVAGASRVVRRWPAAGRALPWVLVAVTLADSPLWRQAAERPWRDLATAATVRAELLQVPADAAVLAQPALIPHLPRRTRILALGREIAVSWRPEYVLLTEVGSLWPLGREGLAEALARWRADPGYRQVSDGPLYLFVSRPQGVGSPGELPDGRPGPG